MSEKQSIPTDPEPWGNTVLVEFDEGIAWVTMNRPEKRNAMNPALNAEMLATLDELEADSRCGVVVLTGAGESFTSGMDLKEFFRETDNLPFYKRIKIRRESSEWHWRRLVNYVKPTIAMVNGWCFGGAFTPMIACDVAIAADEAVFGISEVNWGIIPGGNVSKFLSSVMDKRKALYYVMSGEQFNGRQAAEWGVVTESVPKANLRSRTREVAITLLKKNPTALRACKISFKQACDMTFEQAEDYLSAKHDQARLQDPERGREQAMKQFLDEKSFKPGLGHYRRGG